jgi:hypothetical protein
MKLYLFAAFTIFCLKTNAQVISGKVIDKSTRLPMKYIFVTCTSGSAFTNDNGVFALKITTPFDTVRIKTMGYQPYKFHVSRWGNFVKVIELEGKSIQLGEVRITAKKNYYKDSISLRQDFARQFNFTGPKITDIIRPMFSYVPFAFVSIDVGMLLRALTKKHNPDYKLKQILLRNERENHVIARFYKTLVAGITHLQGDSLDNFMSSYRPTPAILDKLSDYELILYIKTNLEKFRIKGSELKALPTLLKPEQSLEGN